MKKTTLRQAAMKLALLACVLLAPTVSWGQTTLFSEDFEDGSMPTGWTTEGNGSWSVATAVNSSHPSSAGEGTYCAQIKHGTTGDATKLITPEIDLSGVASAELSFMQAHQSWEGDIDVLNVYYRTSSTGTWVLLESYPEAYASWTTTDGITLPNLSSTYQIAFEFVDNWGYGLGIDYVQIVPGATCPKPSGLAATLTPGNGTIATLNWTAGGSETNWVVEYSTVSDFSGATQVTSGFTSSGTNISVDLTGLTAEQTYYARVKADCDGGDYSVWSSETVSFTPTNAFSLTVNDGTTINNFVPVFGYWADATQRSEFIIPSSQLGALNGATLTSMKFYPNYNFTSTGSFQVYLKEVDEGSFSGTTYYTANEASVVYTGTIEVSSTNGLVITFNGDGYEYNGGNLLVGFYKEASGGNYYSESSCPFYGVSATGASISHYSSYSVSQRDFLPKTTFTYEPASAFPKPRNLQVSNVTGHEATLTWETPNDATPTGYFFHYKRTTDANFNQPSDNGTSLSVTLNSLDPETEYQFGVYANYADGESDYKEISFTTDIACPDPTVLVVTDITDDGATLGWTSTAPNFNVRYRTAADPNVLFFDDFENGLSQWTIIRNGEGTEYTDWYQFNGNFNNPITPHSGTYMAMSRSWNNSAYNVDNWLITPQVTLDGTLSFWVMDDGTYHEHYDVYVSTTGNTIADFGTTPFYEPGDASGTWTEITVDLSSFAGAQGYIALRLTDYDQDFLLVDDFAIYGDPTPAGSWTNTTASTNSLPVTGLDEQTTYDFEVQADCGGGEESDWVASTFTTLPSCMPVSTLAVDAATTTTIDLTWTDQNNGAATYVVTDNDDNAYTVTNLTTTGCTVTGLTANTAYTFKVKANCGDGFSSAEMVEGRTACDAITTVPYVESFENADNNYCWTLDGFSVMNNSSYSYEDDKFIIAQNSSTEPRYVVLPEMADDISGLMLNFWWTNYNAGNDLGYLYIGYLTDVNDYTTFEQVGVIDMTSSINAYEQSADYTFTAAPAGSRMALKYVDGTNGGQILIDKVTVDNLAACMRPTDLAVTTPSAHGATFGWTSNGTETAWQLYISENSTAPADDINVNELIPATTNPFVLTSGLNAETEHYVWVRANCNANGYSTWVGPVSFTTECEISIDENTPYTQNFDDPAMLSGDLNSISTGSTPHAGYYPLSHALPSCWRFLNMSNSTNTYPQVFLSSISGYVVEGNCLFFKSSLSTPLYAILPQFENNLSDLMISFTYRNEDIGNNNGKLYVSYMTNPSDANTFNTEHQVECSQMSNLTTVSNVNFPEAPAGSYFAFKYEGGSYNNYYLSIDNVSVSVIPSCWPVATLGEATDIAPTSAKLSWTLVDDNQDAWVVEYSTDENFATYETAEATTNENYLLSPLAPSTTYYVRVKANCGNNGYSTVSNVVTFTTDIACAAPTDLALDSRTTSSLTVSWTENGSASSWTVCYQAEGDEEFTCNNEVDENPYTIEGLTQGTNYTVKVKTNCANGYSSPELVNTTYFQTEASCPAPTNLVVTDNSETAHGATITWEGNSDNDSYTVEYGTATGVNNVTVLSEGFEGGSMPTDWTSTSTWAVGSGSGNTSGVSTAANGNYNVNFFTHTSSTVGYLITPAMNMDGITSATLTFNYVNPSWAGGYFALTVYYRVDGGDWNQLESYTTSQSSWTTKSITLTGMADNYQIGFKATGYNGDYGYGVGLDDITVTAQEPVFTWNPTPLSTNATSPYTINTLDPETQYVVRVKGVCGSTPSPASNIVGFTTLVACSVPENFAVDQSSVTHNSVELSWTAAGGTDTWVVAYKADGDADFTEVNNVTDNDPYLLEGLIPETHYTVKVKSDCGSEGYSQWSEEKSFTTLEACAAPTAFTLGPVTTHEATFSWTAGNGNTAWQVYVKKHDDAEYPATASATVTAATATINELDAATVYDVKIVPNCDDTKLLEVANAFTTECETTVVDADNSFFEGFEGTTFPPICWSVGDPSNNRNWQRSTQYSNTGSASAYSNYYGPIYLYTPILHIDGTTATLSFSSYNTFVDDYDHGKNSVLVSVNGGDWTELWSPESVSDSWVVTTIDMTDYVGQNIQLCFKYEGNNAHGWYIDDVNLYVPTVIEKAIDANKWYAISSPVHNSGDNETLAGVNNITSGTFDLYGYTESAGTWNAPTFLEQGKGYIYRRSANATLQFVGIANTGSISVNVSSSCPDIDLKGFNLIGNPDTHDIAISQLHYTLNTNGTWQAHTSGTIGVAEAFLVQTSEGGSIDFPDQLPDNVNTANSALAFTVSNEEYSDVAYAMLDNGNGLRKIGHLNSEAPMLSIPVEGRRYAIANLGSDCQSFNLVFRGVNGTYTIKQSSNQAIAYCHLIDRVAGKDIDMLRQNYTFSSNGFDADRFMVKLSPDAQENTGSNFAYWNGNNWMVEGNGTLQVFDALGRQLFSQEISNSNFEIQNSLFPAAGVYVLRMGEKTQKIVVR